MQGRSKIFRLLSAAFSGTELAMVWWLVSAAFPLALAGQQAAVATSASPQTIVKPAAQTPEKAPLTVEEIRLAEQQLAALGYWTGAVDGDFDAASRHALMAFQKVEGRTRTGILRRAELAALLLARNPLPRESHYAHIEIDLTRQVLFVVNDKGATTHILPISSGNGAWFTSAGRTRQAITPTGKFTVCRKIAGWRKSPLGLLFYPNYICGGVAIHGSLSVPATPASHGCIRIPMFAAKEFSALTPIGTIVVVHTDKPAQTTP